MLKKFTQGLLIGSGIAVALTVAVFIAYAGDILRVDKDGVVRFWITDTGAASIAAQDNDNPALTVTQAGQGPAAAFSGGKVGIGTASPQGALDVSSTTGGLVVPRMTTVQRDALSPPSGTIIYNTSTNQFNVYDNGAWLTSRPTESYVNLVVESTGASAVRVTADVLFVEGMRLEGVNVTADVASTGAGGRDGGSETADTWYYVWVITNNDGTSRAGLLSTSSVSPTMPSGYTRKRRVGTVKNNATSDFLRFVQEANFVNYTDGLGNNRILITGAATTWTTVTAAAFIPPTSRRGFFQITSSLRGSVGSSYEGLVRAWGSGATYGEIDIVNIVQVADVTSDRNNYAFCGADGSQRLEYMLTIAPTSGGIYIDVMGYYDRI